MKASRKSDSGNLTTTVKPQVYNFEIKSKTPRIGHKNSETQYLFLDQQITEPFTTQISWRPKIPTKKLFEEPKFLMSLQRKKIRVINGIQDADSELLKQQTPANPKRNRIKIRKEISRGRKSSEQQNEGNRKLNYTHNEFFMSTANHKLNKTPIVNFNLQHLIMKRKTFKSEHSSRKKGSNNPYYSHFSSDRFDPIRKHIELNIIDKPFLETRRDSRKTSIDHNNSSVRTAEVRSNLSLHQP